MAAPNLFLVYANDAERSTTFYRDLFGIEPGFVTLPGDDMIVVPEEEPAPIR